MNNEMTDFERRLRDALQQGHSEAEAGRVPSFDTTWAAAQAAAQQRRRPVTVLGGLAAALALVAVVVFSQMRPAETDWQFVDPDEFANSTSWAAPSDVLLPEHRFDIYRDIPVLIESTGNEEGALL